MASSREQFNGQDLSLLSMSAAYGLRLRDLSEGRAPSEDLSGYRIVRRGDLVVNKLSARDGALAVSEYDGIVSPAYWVLRLDPGRIYPRFAHHLLRSKIYLAEIARRSKYMPPAQFDLPWEQFRTLPLALPPLKEQREIADFLDDQISTLNRAIALREQQISLASEQSAARLDGLLRQGRHRAADLIPAEYQPFGRVPRRWRQGRLRSTRVEVQTGPFGSQLNAEEYVDGAWPVVNPSNITREGRLIADETVTVDDATRARLARHVLQIGDVVFGRRGDLGRAGLVTREEVGWVCGTGSLRVRFLEAAFEPAYLTRFLRLPSIRYYFESNSVGSTMQNLNTSLLLGMPLLIPPLDEQRDLAAQADLLAERHEGLVRLLTRSIELMQERKRALITAAVTGRFDVNTARRVA